MESDHHEIPDLPTIRVILGGTGRHLSGGPTRRSGARTLTVIPVAPDGTPTMDENLIRFVDHARTRGLDHQTIRHMLVSVGWRERDIAEVFCQRELDLPVPQPPAARPIKTTGIRRKGSVWSRRARDGFLNLFAFGALYTWATSLIVLLFLCIDLTFPDPAWRMSHTRLEMALSNIRADLAILMVAFPVFLVSWHYLLHETRRDPERAGSGVRRWLGYLSLFVGVVTLSADTMTLLYFLLEGQLTVGFALKSATVFLIAGSLVAYLALTLRSESKWESET